MISRKWCAGRRNAGNAGNAGDAGNAGRGVWEEVCSQEEC